MMNGTRKTLVMLMVLSAMFLGGGLFAGPHDGFGGPRRTPDYRHHGGHGISRNVRNAEAIVGMSLDVAGFAVRLFQPNIVVQPVSPILIQSAPAVVPVIMPAAPVVIQSAPVVVQPAPRIIVPRPIVVQPAPQITVTPVQLYCY